MTTRQAGSESVSTHVKVSPPPVWGNCGVAKDGDLVILFENHQSVNQILLAKDAIFQNRHGAFHHNDMIGTTYGSQIWSKKKNGYIYLLSCSAELWSKALPHRTQIVFTLDASMILFQLGVKPGYRVVESGTGSGALSTYFTRAIAPTGHLYTFEFNEHRATTAKEEFKRNSIDHLVTVEHRDVCSNGFGEQLEGSIDSVFLDLPCPWLAVGHANKLLKSNGTFASYSPCIEQVQKTCNELRIHGFEMIKTMETRLIPYACRNVELPSPDFGKPIEMPEKLDDPNQDMVLDDSVSRGKKRSIDEIKEESVGLTFAKKEEEMRGHTAFLTFACKFAIDESK